MLRNLLEVLRVENNLNKNGLTHVCIALFWCLYVPGGGLERFSEFFIYHGGSKPPLKWGMKPHVSQ